MNLVVLSTYPPMLLACYGKHLSVVLSLVLWSIVLRLLGWRCEWRPSDAPNVAAKGCQQVDYPISECRGGVALGTSVGASGLLFVACYGRHLSVVLSLVLLIIRQPKGGAPTSEIATLQRWHLKASEVATLQTPTKPKVRDARSFSRHYLQEVVC